MEIDMIWAGATIYGAFNRKLIPAECSPSSNGALTMFSIQQGAACQTAADSRWGNRDRNEDAKALRVAQQWASFVDIYKCSVFSLRHLSLMASVWFLQQTALTHLHSAQSAAMHFATRS